MRKKTDPGTSDTSETKQFRGMPPPKPVHIPKPNGFGARLRAYLIAGTLITAPFSITIYVAWLFVTYVDSRVTPLIPPAYNPQSYLPFGIPGLGLIVALVFLTFIGAMTTGFLGRLLTRIYERIFQRMPVLGSLYGATKQIFETLLSQHSTAFRQAVLVEYPRRGMWTIGFITGVTEGEVQALTEDTVINVFLPTTPNPTSGWLVFVPNQEIVRLQMTVEDALKMVVSGGMVMPPYARHPNQAPAIPSTSRDVSA